jgi:hypothetical protein
MSARAPSLWSSRPGERLCRFHADAAVRQRYSEFLGGGARLEEATAHFVTPPMPFLPRPPTELWSLLATEREASRSLWDRAFLLVDLDLEHVHFDRPWQPLAEPARSFAVQRPVVEAILGTLAEYGIASLHLLTGRGHHFVWQIDRRSAAFSALVGIGRLGEGLRRLSREPQAPHGDSVGEELAAAQHGLGKVLEHLAHQVLSRVAGRSPIPVQVTAVSVGPGPRGREIVSLDLSQFGDPLHDRSLRIPFTAYRKGEHLGAPPEVADRLRIVVPVADGDEEASRAAMGDLERAADLAARVSTVIPEASHPMLDLIAAYRGSALAAFHARFESVVPEPPERWPETYDRLDLRELPLCVRQMLELPNDLLLQPAALQILVRVLLAQGWHPGHIAGLIASKYGRDYGWVPILHFQEGGVRAEFYTRLFAGLVALSRDGLLDFNCQSTREKGLCPGGECGMNLCDFRDRLRQGGSHG